MGLCIWLVRKAIKAARTESDLESHRFEGPLAAELTAAQQRAAESQRGKLSAVPEVAEPQTLNLNPFPDPFSRADVVGADPAHLAMIAPLLADAELLWARSTTTHAVWCERRNAAAPEAGAASREVIRVMQIENGKIVGRWSFA